MNVVLLLSALLAKSQQEILSQHRSLVVECPSNGLIQVADSNGFTALNDSDFREILGANPVDYNMIYRHCGSCADSHKHLFYKRLTPIPKDLDFLDTFLNNFTKAPNHKLCIDFRLYTSVNNALLNDEPWRWCTYNEGPSVDFPNMCRAGLEQVLCQWNSLAIQ
jgi:hypothetical protein